jgi:dTDP-4-dehydrorhamnose reductase
MKKVLIIGSSGLLGTSLVKLLAPLFKLITVTRTSPDSDYNIDMTSTSKSVYLLSEIKPDFIVNLAALTNVDACEDDINLAYNVNTKIAENIAKYSNDREAVFVVHISTDHIYDGENSSEDDIVIYNSYAMTKYCAEKSFKSDNSVILRTNFFGKSLSQKSEGLCDSIYSLAASGQELNLFNDVYFSPLSINTLCDVILFCLKKQLLGVFNVGSNEGMSKEDFLKTFLELSGVNNVKYKSISVNDIDFKTHRPKDMRMDVSRFEKAFNYKLPKLINEIESVANEFKKYSIK